MAKKEKLKLTTIEKIQKRIEEAQSLSQANQDKINELRTERAAITVTGSKSQKNVEKLRVIDKKLKYLARSIENAPAELALLEQNLKDEQERIEQDTKDKLITEQKKAARQIESLSEELVDYLSDTMKINTELQTALHRYNALREKTGTAVKMERMTRGSESGGMLKWIWDYCSAEFAGKPLIRPKLRVGCPPV